ncbi:MAG: GAF domain-containing protein [Deltaproteobacteria bacterium]|nr:GAF domain-containing protein [Deltaproteobacteria bacterium]
MHDDIKKIAIIGANKEGMSLLPLLLADKKSCVTLIADSNRDAMLFKLNELGYRLSTKLNIRTTTDLNAIKDIAGLDIIINALQDQATETFLESPEFKDIEKLGTLSTRLLWNVRASEPASGAEPSAAMEQFTLLGSLREIVDAVRLTIDRKELLSVVLKLATESTRAERGSIMLVAPDEGMLRVEIAKGMDEEVVRKIRVPLGEGISGKVALEGKPVLVSGKARGEDYPRLKERSDVKSAMCVPLVVNGEVIGVINVSSSESMHVFTNEDLRFLSSMASLAAEVIQRSNEYERLRIDAAKFTFWKEVDAIMSSSVPMDARLNTVARKLVEFIAGLTCFIYIYNEDRNRLFLRAASIRDSRSICALSLRPGEGIEGSAISAMKETFLVDRTAETNLKRVYFSLPMVSHGTLVGTLNGQVVSAQGISKYQELFLKDITGLIAESVYAHKKAENEKMRSRKIFAVDEAGLEMISGKDPARLATIISATPAAILGAEGSILRVRMEGSLKYQPAATFGLDDKHVREYLMPIERETVMEVMRKKDIVVREFSEEGSPYIRSVLSSPLRAGTDIAGVLTLFNKTSDESFYPCGFSKSDVETFARFVVYAEKSLVNILAGAAAAVEKEHEKEHTTISLFEKKVEIEINRAMRSDRRLTLATVSFVWMADAVAMRKAGFESRFVAYVRKKARTFDVAVRLDKETLAFLFLDTEYNMARLLQSVAEFVVTDAGLSAMFNEGKVEVWYGGASFPRDGKKFSEIFANASTRQKFDINRDYETELNPLTPVVTPEGRGG